MTAQTDALARLERELRRGLAGLPRPDVDDIIDEARSHVSDEVADGKSLEAAVAAFGDPSQVAEELVGRRLAGEAGDVREAGRTRRVVAWLGDFVVGWGPLVLCPIWLVSVAWFIDRFLISEDELAVFGGVYERATVPPLLLVLTVVLLVWGVYYWRVFRGRSVSVGMRMAGISRFEIGGAHTTVLSIDTAVSEPARIVAQPKWYVGVPLALLGLMVAGALFYNVAFAIGSLAQPWDFVAEAVWNREDLEREGEVVDAFCDAVMAGDVATAQSLATSQTADDVSGLVSQAQADGVERIERGMIVAEGTYLVHEYVAGGDAPKTVALTVQRFEEQQSPSVWSSVYRVVIVDTEWEETRP